MTSTALNTTYSPLKPSRSRFADIRGISCHIREWGPADAPLVVLLHGSQDASATFQFVVDKFHGEYHFVAPDWRGHGESGWAPQGYWFHDYLADLDTLLEHISPRAPVVAIAHSLGGNVLNTYAGVRPERVGKIVSLDGFGLREPDPGETPARLRTWLEHWRTGPEPSRAYASVEALAERLVKAHPKLPMDKAMYLAANTSRRSPDGGVLVAFDPKHRTPFAVSHRSAELFACLRAIEAPALWLASDRPDRFQDEPGGWEARLALVRNLRYIKVANTTHNMHHDRPDEIARLIETFLNDERG
jgi:pimeloyl-ACP methyl ester carboxylesterase